MIGIDPMERGVPLTLESDLAHLKAALISQGQLTSSRTVENAIAALAELNEALKIVSSSEAKRLVVQWKNRALTAEAKVKDLESTILQVKQESDRYYKMLLAKDNGKT